MLSADHRQALLQGKPVNLPVDKSNTVRVFISSTFTDMCMERDALLDKAYPEVQAFCQKLGLVFEVVDMRWGVPNTLTADHMSTELCLREIESCQRVSLGPTFIALVGSRYGYRPIPRVIEEKEFEVLLLKHSSDSGSCKLFLKDWFWKDENAVPPVYVLQPVTTHLPHYSDTSPGNRERHEKEVLAWSQVEERLAVLLRTAASWAADEGLIRKEAKHKYFKSVTEWEIDYGLRETRQGDVHCSVFIRDIPNIQDQCDGQQLHRFIDVTSDGSIDREAQELLTGLKAEIVGKCSKTLRVHQVRWPSGVLDTRSEAHDNYLQDLCQTFVRDMKQQIVRRVADRHEAQDEMGWLFEELSHHAALCQKKRSIFCGRAQLLTNICRSMELKNKGTHRPLVVYGPSGTGKTAVMSKLAEEVRKHLGDGTVVVTRLLGTSPLSSEIHTVLKSVCFQVCLAFRLKPPLMHVVNSYSELVQFFHRLLSAVSKKNKEPLVLIFDSLDQLSSTDGAHRLHWLPKECPVKVHLVVSTLPEECNILNILQGAIPSPECYFQVEALSCEHGQQVIAMLMATVRRKLTKQQQELILDSFKHCGQPLMLKLCFDEAKRWSSYVRDSELYVAKGTREAVRFLYVRLEKKHGRTFVSHALGYIACSRNGLSEAELKDILSLDDEVLGDIYQYWSPPNKDIIRLPPLLWTRLRYDIGEYLVERQADGFPVLHFYHRQFIEVAHEMYLPADEKVKRHTVLADFFKGTWSQGKRKTITLPQLKETLHADRKVTAQPLKFGDDVVNLRKLSELPYHLVNAGRIDELKQEVLGNMEWIACKMQATGMKSLLEDFYACTRQVDCPDVQLVQDALLLIWPTISFMENDIDQRVLYMEVLARLDFFKGSYPMIDELCQQCRRWCALCPDPIFTPLCGFFQPPGGPLRTTLTGFRKVFALPPHTPGPTGRSEAKLSSPADETVLDTADDTPRVVQTPGFISRKSQCLQSPIVVWRSATRISVMELSIDCTVLMAGSLDGMMIVWNLQDIEMIHTMTGHSGEVRCIKVIHNKTQAVSGSFDHTLRLWNLVTGKEIYSIPEDHSGYEHFALLQVDEATGVIYSVSGSQIKGWCLENGEPLFQLSGGNLDSTTHTAVMGSNNLILTVSTGATLCVWDQVKGTLQNTHHLPGLSTSIPVCILPLRSQEKVAVGFSDGVVAMVSLDGIYVTEKVNLSISFLVMSECEKWMVAGFGKYAQVFKLDTNTILKASAMDLEHGDRVHTAVISRDESSLITGSVDETIRVWSLSPDVKLMDSIEGMGVPITSLLLSENTLISASRSAYYLKIWNLGYDRQHNTVTPFHNRSMITGLAQDGNLVCFPKTGDSKKVVVWNSEEGVALRTLGAGSELRCLAVAERRKAVVCGLQSGSLLVFCARGWQELERRPPAEPGGGGAVQCLALSSREERLAAADCSSVRVYALGAAEPHPVLGQVLVTVTVPPRSVVSAVAVLADSSLLLGTDAGRLQLYSAGSPSPTALEPHDSRVTCLQTSHCERYAFSGCLGPVQRVWDLSTRRWQHQMFYKGAFFEGVVCAAFSQDDRYIYTGSQDRSIKVWDVQNGSLLALQYVYAGVTRIHSTADGMVASTRLGYVIRQRFMCPPVVDPSYDVLRGIKATCSVRSRVGKGSTAKGHGSRKTPKSPETRSPPQKPAPSRACSVL
ncbi:NACHT domain- and WD repeat-containing protein 1 [Pristis pectinata]|uniref:NACHT domain- and WD repeat-containing protein 1 n=1 Tax=Pristis pectinata TaxID=685728 RepID=UPI00223E7484|nr:NACHT domain- and WD repeat-containing protein 1 [Pristis pectinata]